MDAMLPLLPLLAAAAGVRCLNAKSIRLCRVGSCSDCVGSVPVPVPSSCATAAISTKSDDQMPQPSWGLVLF